VKTKLLRLFSLLLLLAAMSTALFVGVRFVPGHAASCSVWSRCPITQRYGQNYEHGVDLWTQGLPVTALRSGTITFDRWECWDGECVQDITWKLDYPSHAGGSKYMYLQIASSGVHVGEHVVDGQYMGRSGSFIEFGLTPDAEYGVSGWHWGVNVLNVFPYL
jgi:hypothetical protein